MLSSEDYLRLHSKWAGHSQAMAWGVVGTGIVTLLCAGSDWRWIPLIPAGLLLVALPLWIAETIRYQREKYRQGFKIEPWGDIPRTPPEKGG